MTEGQARSPAVWFPTIRANTGTDVFTRRLHEGLDSNGIRAEIEWLPHSVEYLPWCRPVPRAPGWANVVHVNTWMHPRFIPAGLPVVATLHHAVHDAGLRPYKGWPRATYHRGWIAPIERRVLRRAQCVVAVSEFAARVARENLCDVPMEVIYNGVDTDRFRPADRRCRPERPFRMLFVGNWIARKGVDLLAPIMRELGDGFELEYTGGTAAARDRGAMPLNTRDIGRLDGTERMVEAMQRADALILPSRSEGFCLVAIEAMACGLPVIATHGTALAEAVADAKTGFLCPQDDVGAFADAARKLAGDPGLVASMSLAGRNLAVTRFSLAAMVQSYVRVYRLFA